MCTFKHNAKLFKALFWEPHYTLRTDLPLCVFTRCQMPHTYFNYKTTDVQISPCWGVGGGGCQIRLGCACGSVDICSLLIDALVK